MAVLDNFRWLMFMTSAETDNNAALKGAKGPLECDCGEEQEWGESSKHLYIEVSAVFGGLSSEVQ